MRDNLYTCGDFAEYQHCFTKVEQMYANAEIETVHYDFNRKPTDVVPAIENRAALPKRRKRNGSDNSESNI